MWLQLFIRDNALPGALQGISNAIKYFYNALSTFSFSTHGKLNDKVPDIKTGSVKSWRRRFQIKENNQSAPRHKQRTNMQPNPQILLMQRKSFISQMHPAAVTSTAHFKREQDAKGHIPTSVSSPHWNAKVIISKRHCVTMLHCCHTGRAVISIQCRGRERGEERQATADWRQHEMTDIARVYCFGSCAGLEVRVAWVLPTVPVCPSLKCPGMYVPLGGNANLPPNPHPTPQD